MGAVIFGPYGTSMQTWAALVLLLSFFAVFLLAQPYENDYLNKLERSALSINIVTLLAGLGLFTNKQVPDSYNRTLAIFLSVTIVVLNAVFVLNVARTLAHHTQYCKRCRNRDSGGRRRPSGSSGQSKCERNKEQRRVADKISVTVMQAGGRRSARRHGTIRGSLRYHAKVAMQLEQGLKNQAQYKQSRMHLDRRVSQRKDSARSRLEKRLRVRRQSVGLEEAQQQQLPLVGMEG